MTDFVRVPPDSTGKRMLAKQHGETHVQGVHLACGNHPENMQLVDPYGAARVRFPEGAPQFDSFGGMKVSSDQSLGDYANVYDDPLPYHTAMTGGTFTHDPATASRVLSVGSANGNAVIVTSHKYHKYLPGIGLTAEATVAAGDAGKAGNTRRWGYFDADDGAFFEMQGTQINVVLRSSTSGEVVEQRIPREQWNGDLLDGTGLSGFVLDVTKLNIYWCDLQWLGAGQVRMGLVAGDGSRVIVHSFHNAGVYPVAYMRTGSLPMRWENVNTGATGSTSELRHTCATVKTNGIFDPSYRHYAGTDFTGEVSAATQVLAIRPRLTFGGVVNRASVLPENLSIYCTQPVRVDFVEHGTVTGGSWVPAAGTVEYNTAPVVTGGSRIKTCYVNAGAHDCNLRDVFSFDDHCIRLTADEQQDFGLSIVITPLAAAATVTGTLSWRELR
jgi:hypothetical protein